MTDLTFVDRLEQGCTDKGSPLCVGLDPSPALMPGWAVPQGGPDRVGQALEDWCRCILDAVAPHVAVVKPQSAYFERHGWVGARALERTCVYARHLGLTVILDAKRGDIGATSEAYADAYLSVDGEGAIDVDALTVSPYLGGDSLEAFARGASRSGKGIFVCVLTSNPGRTDLQTRPVDGRPGYLRVADLVAALAAVDGGSSTTMTLMGAVVGSTTGAAAEIREVLPRSVLLVPGLGAQGGSLDGLRDARTSGFGGLVVSSSRSVTYPHRPAGSWTELGEAVSGLVRRHVDALIDGGLGC